MRDMDWFGDDADAFGGEVDLQMADALEPFTTKPPSVWCEDNIHLAPGRTSMPGKLRFFEYQKEVIDAFAEAPVSTEESVDKLFFDERLKKYPHLNRYLMGHSTVDLGVVEAVYPSTIFRRLEKEAGALADELGSNNADSPRKMMARRGE